jgi:hypothetical protein
MIHDGGCTDLVGCLPGMGGELQYLAERAKRFSGFLGGVIRTSVRDHHDPERVVPAAMPVGSEDARDTSGNLCAVIVCRYNDPDCSDFGRMGWRNSGEA